MQASDFYFEFAIDEEEEMEWFYFVPRSFWDTHGYLSDNCDHELLKIIPEGFYGVMDAIYEYVNDNLVGKQKLLAAGFIEKKGISAS